MQASLLPSGPEPSMKGSVVCRGPLAFRLVQFEAPEADMGVPLVKVASFDLILPILKYSYYRHSTT